MSVMAEGAAAAGPASVSVRLAAVFLPAPLPREGRVAFWDPADGPLPTAVGAQHTELTVVRRHGSAIRRAQAPALSLPLDKALPLLVRARRDPAAHPATACWGAAALHALRLTARGRLLPGLTPAGHDAWRAGPLDPEDIAHLRAVAAALPYEGHAVPLPGPGPLRLPRPEPLMRSFLDAVADTLPRTPAAPHACGKPFADRRPQRLPGAHDWAAEVAAGMDAGVRVSLRLDLSAYDMFDRPEDGERTRRAGAAIVQVHSLADPTLMTDAAALWAGEADAAFGARARVDAALAVRRAARVWPPLARLAEQDTPDVLALSEDELSDLLGVAATRLAAAGVAVHWPRDLAQDLSAAAVVRPAPVRRPTAPASSRARTCSSSAGSWRSAATRSARPRWTRWPRRTARWSGSVTSGSWSTRRSYARPANGNWASSTRSTPCPSPSAAPRRSTARASRPYPSAPWPPCATASPRACTRRTRPRPARHPA